MAFFRDREDAVEVLLDLCVPGVTVLPAYLAAHVTASSRRPRHHARTRTGRRKLYAFAAGEAGGLQIVPDISPRSHIIQCMFTACVWGCGCLGGSGGPERVPCPASPLWAEVGCGGRSWEAGLPVAPTLPTASLC